MRLRFKGQRAQAVAVCSAGLLLMLLIGYLRDPPWLGSLTSGFRAWEYNRRERIRFRSMEGHASFLVPSHSKIVRIPLRALMVGDTREFVVTIEVNDRLMATLRLPDEQWRTAVVQLKDPALRRRRHVRIDLRVNRTWADGLGVQVGEVTAVGAS
jgi:hypothetical protein